MARQQHRPRLRGAPVLLATLALAQSPSEPSPPIATVKQLMLDLIHPASNEILLFISRGGPRDEKDWAAIRRSAITLTESANLLLVRGRARDQADWAKDARLLADAGAAAYKAAQARDAIALAAVATPLDQSCTACHKHYRPDVFPRQGGPQ